MEPVIDESLVGRLPLPLAQLARRALNAKTPWERHNAAYYLWEAALKLLGSVAIAEYAELDDHDPQLAERLQNLSRPAIGHWWEFVRRLVPVLAEPRPAADQPPAAADAQFSLVRDLLLGRTRDDLPRAAGLYASLCDELDGKAAARSTVRLTELFDRLVRYRNREIGHGAAGQRPGEFYDRMARALLGGVTEVLARLDVLAGRRLFCVDDVRRTASGQWVVERYELAGESPRRMAPLELPESTPTGGLPRPQLIYVEAPLPGAGLLRSLHPLVLHEPDTGETFFLNARRDQRRADYLCYSTGQTVCRESLANEHRALLGRVLGIPVESSAADDWAARSQAEEGPEPSEAAPAGRTMGDFELLSRLGRGGMGVVYRAWQPSLSRQVALKCLLRSGDPKAEARFAREIRALGRVEHPHLVKIFTSGSEADQWFYCMELIDGADLASVCEQLAGSAAGDVGEAEWSRALTTACEQARTKEEPLSGPAKLRRASAELGTRSSERGTASAQPDARDSERSLRVPRSALRAPRSSLGPRSHIHQTVELVRQVAEAAHALHEAGVTHRDIKPGNILLSPDGQHAVLMDLGLAQLADEVDGKLTRTRQFVGTLRYASPEQVLAVDRVDRKSDVYSLGVTLWELLSLRPMYGATEETPTPELMRRIQYEEPERLRHVHRGVPADLEAIVLKCLEKNPAARYGTAATLAEDLARWQRNEPVTARRQTPLYLARKWARRRRRPLAIAALSLLVFALGGLGYWDAFHRTHVEYYNTVIDRWGIKEGFGRLSKAMARTRQATIKQSRHGRWGAVVAIEVVNGQGASSMLPVLHAQIRPEESLGGSTQECRLVYQRDAQGRVIRTTAYDQAGRLVWEFIWTTPTKGYYVDADGYVKARAGSGAAYEEFTFSHEGFATQVRYFDQNGRPQANFNGGFGERYLCNPQGLTTEATCLGIDGQPILLQNGYARLRVRFDDLGNVVEQTYLDLHDKPAVSKEGYARLTASYDATGNRIELAYFGLDGQSALDQSGVARLTMRYDQQGNLIAADNWGLDGNPVAAKSGYAKMRAQYDQRGNRTEESYFDGNDKLTLCEMGFARATLTYDERANAVAAAYFGTDGELVAVKGGFAGFTASYDASGRRIEEAYFGPDRLPAWYSNGSVKATWKYDERGNEIEAQYWGAKGEPVAIKDGYSRMTAQFDSRGNRIEVAWFDPDGSPTLHVDGYARKQMAYDESGNLVEATYFGTDGKPTTDKNGQARWTARYDGRGNRIEEAYFGLGGKAVLDPSGYARLTMTCDERGNEIERSYFGLDDQPALHKDGYARSIHAYDERGNETGRSYYGVEGQRVLHKHGHASIKWRYDPHGNKTETAYFGLDGELVAIADGYARRTTKHDQLGNLVETAYFGTDGRPASDTDGIAQWTARYDSRGYRIEESYFGLDGKPVLHADGYAKMTMVCDAQGNRIETACYGTDGRPVSDTDGAARWTARYDNRGNRIEETYFGLDGKPVLIPQGYARLTIVYDAQGRRTGQSYFGLDGKPALHKEGNASIAWKYDSRGNQVEAAFRGPDGKPVAILDGYTRWTKEYDALGHCTQQTYTGYKGANGFAQRTVRYDERGNAFETAYFDSQGKAAVDKDGHARWTSKYDESGREIEQAYFGPDRGPALHRDGYAKWSAEFDAQGNLTTATYSGYRDKRYSQMTLKYDGLGNCTERTYSGYDGSRGYEQKTLTYDDYGRVIETAFFDAQGGPAQCNNGYAKKTAIYDDTGKLTMAYDQRGNLVEIAYFAPGGKPQLMPEGYARLRINYDERGNRTELDYFGVDGSPAADKDGHAKVTWTYDGKGRETEQAFLGLDGQPALHPDGYARVTAEYDEQGNRIATAYWGSDGKAVASNEGYSRVARSYDERGNQIEAAYFSPDGTPATEAGIYARWTANYDADGKQTEMTTWGVDGKLIRSGPPQPSVVVVEVLPGGQGETMGFQPGDVLLLYDGDEVADMSTFIERRKLEQVGDKPRQLQVLRGEETLTFDVSPGLLGIALKDLVLPQWSPSAAKPSMDPGPCP